MVEEARNISRQTSGTSNDVMKENPGLFPINNKIGTVKPVKWSQPAYGQAE
jgi:hypothetical protein